MVTFKTHNQKILRSVIYAISLLVILVFVILKCSNRSVDTYEPIAENGKGFLGKANALFAKLLEENTVENIHATSLNDLNSKYPAFRFDVPDSLNSDLNIHDVRLVNINQQFINNEDDKKFLESSDLQNLIKQQRLNKDKSLFKIGIKKERGRLIINSIKMIPSLHKIKFANKIWDGDILAQIYNPIHEENSRFLIYGSSVLPVRLQQQYLANNNQIDAYPVYLLDDERHGKGIFDLNQNQYTRFDWYNHYQNHYRANSCFHLEFEDDTEINNQTLLLQVLSDSLVFDLDASLIVTCIAQNVRQRLVSEAGANEGRRAFHYPPDSENIRILIEDSDGHKLTEFQITRHNPLEKLAYTINTNKGKTRKEIDPNYTDVFTQQVVDMFLRNANENTVPQSVALSIDPLLSQALEKELETYGRSYIADSLGRNEHFEISICVLNTATGEILAAPYYNYTPQPLPQERWKNKRNPNMVRRYIGSCFKPIMTLASTQLYPDLLNLTTGAGSGRTSLPEAGYTEILRCPFRQTFAASAPRHYTTANNLVSFLASSNDVFPVVLAMYSFTKFPNFNPLTVAPTDLRTYIERENRRRTSAVSLLQPRTNTFNSPDFDVHKSEFAKTLATLYSIKSEAIINTDSIDPIPAHYLLRYLNEDVVFDEISPDYTNMNYYDWNKNNNKTFRAEVVPWVLGQGNNEWAPLKLAEAWARMVTKYPLRLSYIHTENAAEIYADEMLSQQIANHYPQGRDRFDVWNNFLDSFRAAQSVAAQDMLYPAHNEVRQINNNLIILGKTGTPDDFPRQDWEHFDASGHITYDVGLYAFSLMTEEQYRRLATSRAVPRDAVPRAGITCIVRIVHSYPTGSFPRLRTNFRDGIMSYDARNFLLKETNDGNPKHNFTNTRLRKLLFYTDNLFD